MKSVKVQQVKEGDLLQLKIDGILYVRSYYCRSVERYCLVPYSSTKHADRYLKKDSIVFID